MTNGDAFLLGCCLGISPVLFCITLITWLVSRGPIGITIPGESRKDFTGRNSKEG